MANTLIDWIKYIQSLHVTTMDLSLERVYHVADKLQLLKKKSPVVTVAGTNGKGSCVAGLEAIYRAAGYQVGAFTSPVLFCHNEYVRINGQNIADQAFCDAYARIEAARHDMTLTPFEFTALAAFILFQEARLDVWILEVGLGGRFDAVNVMDADVAIVANIGLDHMDWLGDTREKIGYEKAGIFRSGKPAICGDLDPPQTIVEYANKIGAYFYQHDTDFYFETTAIDWCWMSKNSRLNHLPLPQLALQNMATVLMAIELLQPRLPITVDAIKAGLSQLSLPGRIQVMPDKVTRIFDVSHNPAAAELLADYLSRNPYPKIRAVFSMLSDKDIVATLLVMKEWVNNWYIASLPVKRGASTDKLLASFQQAGISSVSSYVTIDEAYQNAMNESEKGECVVIFGSFHTVAEVMASIRHPEHNETYYLNLHRL